MLVFGSVPSRRLGRSLGINRRNTAPIPLPSGSDKSHGNSAPCFYSPEAIFDAVKQHLEKLKTRKEIVDYLTFVPDGEPTLDAGLVKSIELLRGLNYSGPQKTDQYGHHLYTAGTGFCIPGGNY